MSDPEPQRARQIFLEVIAAPASEQAALLDERCRGAPALRRAVGVLMENDRHGSFLADSPVRRTTDEARRALGDEGAGPGGSVVPGTVIGPYRVDGVLAVGGMGEVYRAFDTRIRRPVALKSIAGCFMSADARQRFEREAEILARLEHPNICRMYDFFSTRARDYLVLELIEGTSLRARRTGRQFEEALLIAEQIAGVLAAAHAAGIVHRDLKPENVMVTPVGDAKVLDFGLACAVADLPKAESGERPKVVAVDDPTAVFRTRMKGIVGTPMFMSPEQARGEPATVASDMYAFGLLLQMLFTGEAPYPEPHDLLSLLERARVGGRRAVHGVRADVATLIQGLTMLEPSARLTAVEATAAIRRIRGRPTMGRNEPNALGPV